MAAVSLIKRPEEQTPPTRFTRKLAENIKVHSMFAASPCAVLPISFKEQADRATKLYIYTPYIHKTSKRWEAFSMQYLLFHFLFCYF